MSFQFAAAYSAAEASEATLAAVRAVTVCIRAASGGRWPPVLHQSSYVHCSQVEGLVRAAEAQTEELHQQPPPSRTGTRFKS